MKLCSVLLVTVLSAVSALGQVAKANVTPPEVMAGKNITITVTVDSAPLVNNTQLKDTAISVILASRDSKDIPPEFGIGLSPTSDPKIYTCTKQFPVAAKGTWFLKRATLNLSDGSGDRPLAITNNLEFTVKPADLKLPTKGAASLTVP